LSWLHVQKCGEFWLAHDFLCLSVITVDVMRLYHALSGSFRNLEPTLHRGPRKAALEPEGYVLEGIEANQFASAIEADEVAHPAKHRDIRNRVFTGEPFATTEALIHYGKDALTLGDVAVARALVLVVAAGEFVEEAD